MTWLPDGGDLVASNNVEFASKRLVNLDDVC